MKTAPYSLQEAQKLCKDYQYLIGQEYAREGDAFIECITIAPFDEASRKRFLIFYFLFDNAEKAINQEFKGLLFEVLVIARSASDKHELLQIELSTWLSENKENIIATEKQSASFR